MRTKLTLIAGLLCCISYPFVNAQPYPAGTASFAEGGCILLNRGAFTSLQNPSLSAFEKKAYLAFSISNFYTLKELNHKVLVFSIPWQRNCLGMSFQDLGNRTYFFRSYGISLAHTPVKGFAMGLKSSYDRININAYGSAGRFILDASVVSEINQQLSTSFLISGICTSENPDFYYAKNPASIHWAVAYRIDRKIQIQAECVKAQGFKTGFKGGIRYNRDSSFIIHAGLSTPFRKIGFGFRFNKKKIEFGLAFSMDVLLGISSNISLAYVLRD